MGMDEEESYNHEIDHQHTTRRLKQKVLRVYRQ